MVLLEQVRGAAAQFEGQVRHSYKWIARARPDILPTPAFAAAIHAAATSRTASDHAAAGRAAAWLSQGVGADRFILLSRAAVPALGNVTRFFSASACGSPNAAYWSPVRSPHARMRRVAPIESPVVPPTPAFSYIAPAHCTPVISTPSACTAGSPRVLHRPRAGPWHRVPAPHCARGPRRRHPP